MVGRFEGLSDLEWKLFEDVFSGYTHWTRKPGRRPVSLRWVLNSQLYILITGSRWCDLPKGPQWAPKSVAHRYLKIFQEMGLLEHLKERVLALAQERGLICWTHGAVDGSFSPWKGRRSRSGARV